MLKRGSVWWVQFDPAIGQEIKKTRPAVIVSNDKSNNTLDRFQIVLLTTKADRLYPGEALVRLFGKTHKAITSQLDTASIERFKRHAGLLSDFDMVAIDKAFKIQLDLF